jgi:Methane oxygenase PmoA
VAEPARFPSGAAAEPVLATLTLVGRTVAEYRPGRGLDPTLTPRPHLHPVRTLDGMPVTDAGPDDHPWHLGLSVGVPDVDGANFWGGPTYLRGRGYRWRADHGRIEHLAFTRRADDGFDETLRWHAAAGEVLLAEDRRVRARLVEHGWELELVTTLTNATARPLRLGSPATNGRDGAGYGGLFWRLPPASAPRVRTATTEGEQAVHGAAAPWLAWESTGFTLVFAPADAATRADPWFVRVTDYPGVGSQLAARSPVVLAPGAALTRGLRTLVADGTLDDAAAACWATDVESHGSAQLAADP